VETAGGSTTQPPVVADNTAGQNGNPPSVTPPTTQSSDTAVAQAKTGLTQEQAETEFDRLSAAYSDASHKSLDQQPLEELQAGYEKIVTAAVLPSTLQARAEADLAIIKQRSQDKVNYVAALAKQDALHQRQVALVAEQKELEQIIANNTVQTYAAVGTLRLSSLQTGSETLYRLTDPRTGRTMIYLRSNDPKYAQMVEQFVGVRGQMADDPQLQQKVIAVTSAEPVDPAKVNTRIVAPIIPPSLLPQSGTAKVE
jgi:DNA polymerase III alpha subunit (gram-positive type)